MTGKEEELGRVMAECIRRFTEPYRRLVEAHYRAGLVTDLEMQQLRREVEELRQEELIQEMIRAARGRV